MFLAALRWTVSRCGRARNEISVSFSKTVKNFHWQTGLIVGILFKSMQPILYRSDMTHGVCENILTFIRRNTNYQELSEKINLGLNFKQMDRC